MRRMWREVAPAKAGDMMGDGELVNLEDHRPYEVAIVRCLLCMTESERRVGEERIVCECGSGNFVVVRYAEREPSNA